MPELRALSELASERLAEHLRALDPHAPAHRVEFSPRITESWALIYYRRRLVRLSPYLFLLDPDALKNGSHWRELDATLRHEAAHAYAFHAEGDTGHSAAFHAGLAKLGLISNGACDLGPENAAYRYVYACPACNSTWHRRALLKGNWSCGGCAAGRYDAEFRLALVEERDLARELAQRREWMVAALMEGTLMREVEQSHACGASSSSATRPPRRRASP